MGAVQSNYMKSLAQTLNQNITNLMINIINESTLYCDALQTNIVTFGNGCEWINYGKQINIDLNGKLNQNCMLTQEATTDIQSQLTTVIKNAVEQTLKQDAKNDQGFLATAFGFQENYSEQITNLINIVETNIDISIANKCATAALINQFGGITYCGVNYADINHVITTEASQIAIGTCITGTVVSAILNNTYLNDIIHDADQSLYNKQGLDAGAIAGIVIAIVVVLIGIVLGVYYGVYAKKGGKLGLPSINNVPAELPK